MFLEFWDDAVDVEISEIGQKFKKDDFYDFYNLNCFSRTPDVCVKRQALVGDLGDLGDLHQTKVLLHEWPRVPGNQLNHVSVYTKEVYYLINMNHVYQLD